ncbi:hypothetical protein KFE26_16165 [Shewanella sp. M16]|uniref:hypothetical protein n=1 Tax=Shewanella sp. M16 TaxID=2830837 RepID=UPI001BAF8D09|nr:hypothetical protein [Shewanella sp. M16]MBS0043818.1 hypothetical protein [Shewanella sp. M16]
MSYEWVKDLMPLAGVGLGVYLVPYIESRKSKSESKRAIDCFYAELADYEKAASSYVKNYYESYWILWKADKGQKFNDRFYELTLAPRLEFLSLETLLSKSLLELSSDQRMAVKALKSLADKINKNSDLIGQAKSAEDFVLLIGKFRANTEMLASFYYLVSRMHHEADRFAYLDLTNSEVVKKVNGVLGISFEWEDLAKANV